MIRRPETLSPDRRSLRAFAFDPMLGRAEANRIVIQVPWEKLGPGPKGARIEVVDFDGARDRYYRPLDLDQVEIALQLGLPPSESDPQFHQQMVYAVASRVLENFDHALGRRIGFHRGRRLRLFPHAFVGSNAFYDPNLVAVLFGYFAADEANPGPNLPGQTIFTCLSHDIIAHEVTHAIVHRLLPRLNEPTHFDVPAFHEGFADIVAIFQHFSFPGVLRDAIRKTQGDLRSAKPLVELAAEFGNATGTGRALRSAVDQPDPHRYHRIHEPHARGSILVAAVFDGFFTTYQRRIEDLIRIASGGTGRLPEGALLPDLVERLAIECAKTAQSVLTMCIRAFDYLPPVDVRFGDFLRALVTADFDLAPSDEIGLRAAMIEAFRKRGIYPDGARSLAEDSLLLDPADGLPAFPDRTLLHELLAEGARRFSRHGEPGKANEDHDARRALGNAEPTNTDDVPPNAPLNDGLRARFARAAHQYAKENLARLGLREGLDLRVDGFHTVHRVAPDGSLLVEVVVRFGQTDTTVDPGKLGGVLPVAGATVVFRIDGTVRHVISKPFSEARRKDMENVLEAFDRTDPRRCYADDAYLKTRLRRAMEFSRLCRGRGA